MKKLSVLLLAGISAAILFSGCLAIQLGGGHKSESQKPTVGQQLIDLQRAKDSGAINDTDYQSQKAKILSDK